MIFCISRTLFSQVFYTFHCTESPSPPVRELEQLLWLLLRAGAEIRQAAPDFNGSPFLGLQVLQSVLEKKALSGRDPLVPGTPLCLLRPPPGRFSRSP